MGQVDDAAKDAGSGPQDRKPGCDAPMVPGSASLEVAKGPQVGELGAPTGAAGLQVDLLSKMLLSMGCTGGYGEDGDSGDEMDDLGRNVSIQEPGGIKKNIDSLETKDKDAFVSTMNELLRMYDEGASRLSMCEFLQFWGLYPYSSYVSQTSEGAAAESAAVGA